MVRAIERIIESTKFAKGSRVFVRLVRHLVLRRGDNYLGGPRLPINLKFRVLAKW